MRLKADYKTKGTFWLPSNKANKVEGILSIKDGGIIQLETIGGSLFDDSNDYEKCIIGLVENSKYVTSELNHVTLEKCYLRKICFTSKLKTYVFQIDFAFLNVQYDEKEELKFNTFSFSIESINEWFGWANLSVNKDKISRKLTIEYTPKEDISINLKSEIQMFFQFDCFAPEIEGDGTICHLKEKPYIKLVSKKPLPLNDFIKISSAINQFICFAMNRIVCLEDVTVSSELIQYKKQTKNWTEQIKLYYRSRPFSKITQKERILFSFNSIKKNAENLINNWIDVCEISNPSINLYFSIQEKNHKFAEISFLVLIQSLEALCQRIEKHNIGKSIKFLLNYIIDPFKDYVKDKEKFIKSIIDIRNYFTHYNPNKKQVNFYTKELDESYLKLEAFFKMALLKKIGIPDQKIEFIAKHQLKYKLNPKIEDLE